MPVIDIIALCVIGIFAVIGLFHGLMKSLFKTFSLFIIVIVPILICDSVLPVVENQFGNSISNSISSSMITAQNEENPEDGFFYQEIDLSSSENVKKVYTEMGWSGFFASIATAFSSKTLSESKIARPIDVFPQYLMHFLLKCITFVGLMAVTAILLVLLKLLLSKTLLKFEFIKALDKIGGMAFGLLFGLIVYSVVFFVITSLQFSFLSGIQADIASQLEASKNSTTIAYALSNSFIIEYLKSMF